MSVNRKVTVPVGASAIIRSWRSPLLGRTHYIAIERYEDPLDLRLDDNGCQPKDAYCVSKMGDT